MLVLLIPVLYKLFVCLLSSLFIYFFPYLLFKELAHSISGHRSKEVIKPDIVFLYVYFVFFCVFVMDACLLLLC